MPMEGSSTNHALLMMGEVVEGEAEEEEVEEVDQVEAEAHQTINR